MAKVEVKVSDDFALRLSTLAERTDEIIPKVLEAGAEVVVSKVRSNLQSVIGKSTKLKSRSTGELVSALGVTTAKQDRNGDYNIKIGFSEPRSGGASNAKIANIIEYGKHGQPPKPFLKPAKSQTKSACEAAMKAKFESEVGSI